MSTPFESTMSSALEISGAVLGTRVVIGEVEVGLGFNVSLDERAGGGEVTVSAEVAQNSWKGLTKELESLPRAE